MKATDIFLETIDDTNFHTRNFSNFPLNYPMHYHPHLELLYCHKGEFQLHLDKYTYPLREGNFAIISPMAVHCVSCKVSCSCTCLHIPESLYLQMDAAQPFRAQQVGYVFPFRSEEFSEDEENLQKIYQWEKRTGRCDGGLYGRMIAPGNRREVWYVSIPDYLWFQVWGIVKNAEKQKEILRDQLQYAMTKEYAMIERYDEKEPYFCPWSPNGSAMGRVILMMLELSETE